MDPKQLSQLLEQKGLDASVVSLFSEHSVSGQLIVEGLDDDDLVEMGIDSGIKRKAVKAFLKQLSAPVLEGVYSICIRVVRLKSIFIVVF